MLTLATGEGCYLLQSWFFVSKALVLVSDILNIRMEHLARIGDTYGQEYSRQWGRPEW